MDETRTENVRVRVRPTEREIIERAAALRGWSMSDYMRAAALTCSAIDGEPAALKLVAHNFVEAVRDFFGGRKRGGAVA